MSFPRPDGMEIACVSPGVWLVEGYTVERVKGSWSVSHRFTGEPERVYGKRRTLTEAVELIETLEDHSGKA